MSAAKRYARAVFELANESGQLDKVTEEFNSIGALVANNANLAGIMSNPMVDVDARKNVMRALMDRVSVTPLTKNSVLLITDHAGSATKNQDACKRRSQAQRR
jgi:F-type H+-transporting ATPase subunit delta